MEIIKIKFRDGSVKTATVHPGCMRRYPSGTAVGTAYVGRNAYRVRREHGRKTVYKVLGVAR